MTVESVTAIVTPLVNSLGFPVVLVGAALWFFATRIWPYYVKRTEANDAARAKREESYTTQVAQTGAVIERTIGVLDRMSAKLDSQHVEVLHALQALRGKPHLESDRDR